MNITSFSKNFDSMESSNLQLAEPLYEILSAVRGKEEEEIIIFVGDDEAKEAREDEWGSMK